MRVDFSKGEICIIGDLMLDRYCLGSVSRISPEAPVPVVRVSNTFDTLGGAGNVAHNCSRLGARVRVIGAVGSDENGAIVRRLCLRHRIRLTAFPSGSQTTTKTRVIGESQQIVRIDFEQNLKRPDTGMAPALKKTIARRCAQASTAVIVLSDYGKGLCSPELTAFVIKEARKRGVPVIVDPKGNRWEKYRGASVVTPNIKELAEVAGRPVKNDSDDIAAQARRVRARYAIGALFVTRSEKGMTLVDEHGVEHFPTEAREVFDVSGAGDTVVATLAACLANGIPLRRAAVVANKAAGIVVGKVGTTPIELGELRAALDNKYNPKLLDANTLVALCSRERNRGRTIIFTNGCFDILHRGHVHLLEEAKKLGDLLVVALNSDRSAKAVRGGRPAVNTESDRAHLVAAIDAVDYVAVFNEKTPAGLIRRIRPDVIVKGGNYRAHQVVGREYAKRTVIIPHLAGYSTRDITRKIGWKKDPL